MKRIVIKQIYNLKTWTLCAALSVLNNVALARPSMADVYDTDASGWLWGWVILFALGAIVKFVFNLKNGSCLEWGLIAFLAIIGLVIVYGLGNAFIHIADKYPLLAIAIVAFYWWAWKRDKKQK